MLYLGLFIDSTAKVRCFLLAGHILSPLIAFNTRVFQIKVEMIELSLPYQPNRLATEFMVLFSMVSLLLFLARILFGLGHSLLNNVSHI